MKEIKKNVKDGDIILMHDIHPTTVEALKKVLPWLVKNDYDILTVSELPSEKALLCTTEKHTAVSPATKFVVVFVQLLHAVFQAVVMKDVWN